MKKFILFFVFLAQFAFSQEFEWAKVDSIRLSTNPTYLVRSVETDLSGNVISSRLENSKQNYSLRYFGDVLIEKFDPHGSLLWQKRITGKCDIIDIKTDNQNNIYALGVFRDTVLVDSIHFEINDLSQNHSFLLKLNSSGQALWLKDFTAFNPDYYTINAINTDNSNHLWIAATKLGHTTFLQKLDSGGNVLQTIDQTNVLGLSGFAFDPFGNIFVTGAAGSGTQSFNGYSVNAPFSYNIYIAKYSPAGKARWVQYVEDITFQTPVIESDSEGNAYISAGLFDSTTFGNISAQGPDWVFDYFLTKIDSAGNFIWVNEIPGSGNSLSGDATVGHGKHLAIDNSDCVYISGFYRGTVDWGSGVVSASNNFYYSAFLNKYASNGDVLWSKTVNSTGYDRADHIVTAMNGSIYFTGITSDSVHFDSLLFRTTFAGTFLAKLSENATEFHNTFSDLKPNDIQLAQNFPNPFNPRTTIEFSLPRKSVVSLQIFNSLGQLVETLVSQELSAGTYSYHWQAGGFASGVYYYQLKTKSGWVQSKKLLLIK